MKIIKEIVRLRDDLEPQHKKIRRVIIRTRTYDSTFAYIQKLVDELMVDFPDIKTKDIDVIRYAGDHYARTMGIESNIPNVSENKDVFSKYTEVYQVEYTY